MQLIANSCWQDVSLKHIEWLSQQLIVIPAGEYSDHLQGWIDNNKLSTSASRTI
jgi:hypothetical protein